VVHTPIIDEVSGDRNRGRWLAGYRARWSALSLLSKILLVLSTLSALEVVVVLLFVAYLFVGAYSGGNDPTSPAPLLFPIAIAIFFVVGGPSMLLCGLLWAGFTYSRQRRTRPGGPARRRRTVD
jgi:hypothetical protein